MSNTTFSFCTTLEEFLESRRAVGETGKEFKSISAASTQNNLVALRNLMVDFRPKATLEIGLAYGASCLTLAASHQEIEKVPSKQHVAIDPFQSTVWDNVARQLVDKAALSGYVDIRENYSHIVLPEMAKDGKKFELIYIDGSHLFEDVFIDFYYSNRLLKKSGLIAFDDSGDSHVKKVLAFINSNFSENYRKVDMSQYREGFDKQRYKFASMIGRSQLTVYEKVGKSQRSWNSSFWDF